MSRFRCTSQKASFCPLFLREEWPRTPGNVVSVREEGIEVLALEAFHTAILLFNIKASGEYPGYAHCKVRQWKTQSMQLFLNSNSPGK